MTELTSPFALPIMMTELAMASWETIWHRTALILTGACSQDEYGRMVQEKMHAVHQSGQALMEGRDTQAVLRPFHKRATANAKRLRAG